MITFPITLPTDGGPSRASYHDNNVVGVTSAPFSLSEQIQEFDGQAWELELNFPPMAAARGAAWVAALRSLRGPAGTFYFRPPRYEARGALQAAGATVLVDGAGQSGLVLAFDSVAHPSLANAFRKGDLISLGSGVNIHLHAIVEDVSTDGSGKGSVTIWPRLRASPADNAAIEIAAPLGLFRLVNRGVDYDQDEVGNYYIAPTPIREAF